MNSEISNKKINSENENNNEININVNTNENNNENNNTEIKYNQSNEVLDLNTSKINPETTDAEEEKPPKNNIAKRLKKIFIITFAISIIICAIIVGIIIKLKKSKNKKEEENEENLIDYKISNLIYNSTKEEKINTTFNTIGMKKYRNDVKKINSEYLFLIVSEPNEINNYFLGYIILLKRTEFLNEKEKKIFDDSKILNEDILRYQEENGAKLGGREWLLPTEYRYQSLLPIKQYANKQGILVSFGDYGLYHLGDCMCCCGIDYFDIDCTWNSGNFTTLIKNKKGLLFFTDLLEYWHPEKSISRYVNSKSRLFDNSMLAHLRNRWNRPGTANAPDSYYGVVCTDQKDVDGNYIYDNQS